MVPRITAPARRAWRYTLSVYWVDTPEWRWLKSGGLVFFGLLCWLGGNLLLSYRPDLAVFRYVLVYGILLTVWGPFTHLLVVPAVIRLRRTAKHPVVRLVARHGCKLNLTVFFAIVLVVGAVTPAVLVLDVGGFDRNTNDVAPVQGDLRCTVAHGSVACELHDPAGFDHVVVLTGERVLMTVDDPPFAFEIGLEKLEDVAGGKHLVVELRSASGETLRRYVRTV